MDTTTYLDQLDGRIANIEHTLPHQAGRMSKHDAILQIVDELKNVRDELYRLTLDTCELCNRPAYRTIQVRPSADVDYSIKAGACCRPDEMAVA